MKSVDKTLPYRAAGRHLLSTEGLWRASVDTALPHSALQRVCLSTETTLLKHQCRIKGLKTYEKVAVLSGTGSSAVTTTDRVGSRQGPHRRAEGLSRDGVCPTTVT